MVYVLLGLIGLPIFTEGGGLMYLAKPSCGFLLGLPLMAMVIGLLTRDLRPRHSAATLFAVCSASRWPVWRASPCCT